MKVQCPKEVEIGLTPDVSRPASSARAQERAPDLIDAVVEAFTPEPSQIESTHHVLKWRDHQPRMHVEEIVRPERRELGAEIRSAREQRIKSVQSSAVWMLSAACNIRSQRDSGRESHREGKACFGRNGPGVDIVLRERAELIDQLPIIIGAGFEWCAGLMIEQPCTDTVPNLAAVALLIERARRIESEVINVGLPLLIDEAQRELDRSLPVR